MFQIAPTDSEILGAETTTLALTGKGVARSITVILFPLLSPPPRLTISPTTTLVSHSHIHHPPQAFGRRLQRPRIRHRQCSDLASAFCGDCAASIAGGIVKHSRRAWRGVRGQITGAVVIEHEANPDAGQASHLPREIRPPLPIPRPLISVTLSYCLSTCTVLR